MREYDEQLVSELLEDEDWEAVVETFDEALEIELGPRAYRALTGLSYRDKRAEAGELVDDLPEESVEWLLNDGHIEKVED